VIAVIRYREVPSTAMSPAEPLDVAILLKTHGTADSWEPYQEYGVKAKESASEWSCYILAKEGEVSFIGVFVGVPCSSIPNQPFSVRCTNRTKSLLAVRISVDVCYVQQYLLRPRGGAGDTVTCHGPGSHAMMFHLISGKAPQAHQFLR
jgi:hypothetical protein